MTDHKEKYLGPLLNDPSRIRREAGRRRKPFEGKSVAADALPEHEADGWQIDRPLKKAS